MKNEDIEYSTFDNQEVLVHNGVLSKQNKLIFLEFTADDTVANQLLATAFSGSSSSVNIDKNINIKLINYYSSGYRQETTRISKNHVRVMLFHEDSLKTGGFGFTKEEANNNILNIIKNCPLPYPVNKEQQIFKEVCEKLIEEHNISFGEDNSGFYYGLVNDWMLKLEEIILSNLDDIVNTTVVKKINYVQYKFAYINKQSNLDGYKEQCNNFDDHYFRDCNIAKTIELSSEQFEHFSQNLLDDTDLLRNLKDNESGCYYDNGNKEILSIMDKYVECEDSNENFLRGIAQNNEIEEKGLLKEYYAGMKTSVVLFINQKTKESFVVDTQGYEYARYVGLPIKETTKEKIKYIDYHFTNVRQNSSIVECKEKIKSKECYPISCHVRKVIKLSDENFNDFSENLLSVTAFLTDLKKNESGRYYGGNNAQILEIIAKYPFSLDTDKAKYILSQIHSVSQEIENEGLNNEYYNDFKTNVVLVVNEETKEEIAVDTQGNPYAKIIGLPINAKDELKVKLPLSENKAVVKPIEYKKEDKEAFFEFADTDLRILKQFVGWSQYSTISYSLNESNEMNSTISKLVEQLKSVPSTYETEDIEDPNAILHYFKGGCDWWIIEKDMNLIQEQAYGLVSLNGNYPEYGYINIEELKSLNVELDFYFTPKSAKDLKSELECV